MGLASAQQLLAAGTPFVYLTLTNDHQRPTEKAHDATLKWSRTLDGASAATVRLIGPPGMFVVESYRKKMLVRRGTTTRLTLTLTPTPTPTLTLTLTRHAVAQLLGGQRLPRGEHAHVEP